MVTGDNNNNFHSYLTISKYFVVTGSWISAFAARRRLHMQKLAWRHWIYCLHSIPSFRYYDWDEQECTWRGTAINGSQHFLQMNPGNLCNVTHVMLRSADSKLHNITIDHRLMGHLFQQQYHILGRNLFKKTKWHAHVSCWICTA